MTPDETRLLRYGFEEGEAQGVLVRQFRGSGGKGRRPLHPSEKLLTGILSLHLCFLPWALGTMHAWSQLVSLGLGTLGLLWAVCCPVHYAPTGRHPSARRRGPVSRLLGFPIFWLGLGLLAYVAIQALNPSWRYTSSVKGWWLVKMPDVPWLPTSVDGPFPIADAWRELIVYAGIWAMVCSVWVGLTRRRSIHFLLGVLTINAMCLALLLVAQRVTGNQRIPWPLIALTPRRLTASFIYHNHAGAYFALLTFAAISLAVATYDEGVRRQRKSTPAGVLALAGLMIACAVAFTLSRGASLTLALALIVFAVWFCLRCRLRPSAAVTDYRITLAMTGLFGAFVVYALCSLDFSAVANRFAKVIELRDSEVNVASRLQAREAGKSMWEVEGWRGVGAGGFRYLFPNYVRFYPDIYKGGHMYWEHLHDDWLEMPIELGLAGCTLVAAGSLYWMGYFLRRRSYFLSPVMPLLFGCAQTLVHAWGDFPFQCPAILGTWCVMIALVARYVEMERMRRPAGIEGERRDARA